MGACLFANATVAAIAAAAMAKFDWKAIASATITASAARRRCAVAMILVALNGANVHAEIKAGPVVIFN